MLRNVRRYVRERIERKVVNKKKEKTENLSNKRGMYSYRRYYNSAPFVPRFAYQLFVIKQKNNERGNSKENKCKSFNILDHSWAETIGLSGTLAFGWALSQNLELKRRQFVNDFIGFHNNQQYYPWKKALCPYYTFKNVLPKQIRAQPNDLLDFEELLPSTDHNDEDKLEACFPVFGPPTAEQALNEAKEGLKKAHNVAIGELENRLGVRYMAKRRYRKAVVHFSAGSALRNHSATFNLAQCYELGLGTAKDLTKAAKCYHKASELGNATATYNLAVFYAQGLGGLNCDLKKARELLERADDLGDPNAKSVLESYSKKSSWHSLVKNTIKEEKLEQVVTSAVKSKPAGLEKVSVPFPSKIDNSLSAKSKDRIEYSSVIQGEPLIDRSKLKTERTNNNMENEKKLEAVEPYLLYPTPNVKVLNHNSKLPDKTHLDVTNKVDGSIPFLMKFYKMSVVSGQ